MSVANRTAADGLSWLLRPDSIAVVGATDRPGSYGGEALGNLALVDFPGRVYGVNPNRQEVLGRECVPTVADLPEAVDAVIVAIPAAGVPDAIEQAGARGCGGAVVFSAGFAEVVSGRGLQDELVASARRHGLGVVGPNCNGIVIPARRLALWGDALSLPEPGPVALISQSGNVAVNALESSRGLRFHTVIASGNQAVLSAADYLEALAAEEGIGAIAMYLEDDGGPRFVDALAAAADAGVAVVVLKVGSSEAGARAAAAHSGALAGDQRVFRALMREAGAVVAQDVHELLELSKAIATRRTAAAASTGDRKLITGRGLAIMTCSGGDSAQGADEVDVLGLSLPELAPRTRARLEQLLPSAATAANPLDYTSMLWGEQEALGELVCALGEDPGVDQVVIFYDQPPGLRGAAEESWATTRAGFELGASLSPVPTIVCSTLPELLDDRAAVELHRAGIATAAGLRTGLRCAAALATLAAMELAPDPAHPTGDRLRAIAEAARTGLSAGAGGWLAEHDAKRILRDAGVAVPRGRLVATADDAVAARRELGGPIALKLSSSAVQHKSELGGVRLSLSDDRELRDAFAAIARLADEHGGSVLAERMAPAGTELIVAAHRGGSVPALVVGLGGIWTELLDDVAVIPLPASAKRVQRALSQLRGAALLFGGRGRPGVDVAAVAELAQRLGELLVAHELEAVECNPVLAGGPGTGAVAVDAMIREG
ncbi:MAG TPA: acetate--CoA ligase family protein [Solirubrobacteraceae bacterium]|nr:acetate--CoA ligase family protein [Solirubrobacteraceae bacterium]